MTISNVVAVSAGAIVGALARCAISHISSEATNHTGFPFGTLAVNVLGCFLVGWVLTWPANHDSDTWRLLAATGFCGAFTTFSAFAYESMEYWEKGQIALFALNLALNNILGLVSVVAGVVVRKQG